MIRRTLVVCLVFVAAMVVLLVPGRAAEEDALPVVVLDVRKPADQRLLDWVADTIAAGGAHAFVLQLDSPGVSSGDPAPLFAAMSDAARAVPVVTWVGPDPAVAHGGVLCLALLADRSAAAPGTALGYLKPTVVADPDLGCPVPTTDAVAELLGGTLTVTAAVPGVVDEVAPTIGQVIVGLDGLVVPTPAGPVTLDTAVTETLADGSEVTVPSRPVEFRKPGLFDRFLRLAARPEAAWFFLVVGISLATFEFYAAGIGITAAVAALSLFLAGYGMATLPIDLAATAATFIGLGLYTWDFQRVAIGWRSLLGTALLLYGGLFFTDASPQFGPVWWIVLAVVVGAALFYAVALTTIARSRFSTRTIGRDHLIGKPAVATTDLTPEGVIDVDGAHWRARAHREAGIRAGDPVAITAVSGVILEVEPGVRD